MKLDRLNYNQLSDTDHKRISNLLERFGRTWDDVFNADFVIYMQENMPEYGHCKTVSNKDGSSIRQQFVSTSYICGNEYFMQGSWSVVSMAMAPIHHSVTNTDICCMTV